ncbi:MAG: 4Fe-4S binding protein [Burkholderia sp.]
MKDSSKGGSARAGAAVTRREAIAAGGAIVGMLALGGAAAAAPRTPLVRPPGALEEKEFLERCIKCDRCRSACHLNGIGVAGIRDGFTEMRTPKMDFRAGWCDFCMACNQVCPTGALKPLPRLKMEEKPKAIGTAEITRNCIALRSGGCTKCYEACNESAITLNPDNVPVVDPESCTGCGICVLVCPANVLQFSGSIERGIRVVPVKKGGKEK